MKDLRKTIKNFRETNRKLCVFVCVYERGYQLLLLHKENAKNLNIFTHTAIFYVYVWVYMCVCVLVWVCFGEHVYLFALACTLALLLACVHPWDLTSSLSLLARHPTDAEERQRQNATQPDQCRRESTETLTGVNRVAALHKCAS